MRNWSLARLFGRLGAALLVASLVTACEPSPRRDRTQATRSQAAESDAPYQAEVEEGLGAAVAILVAWLGGLGVLVRRNLLVIYMSLSTGDLWARPQAMWSDEIVWPDGEKRPRFVPV